MATKTSNHILEYRATKDLNVERFFDEINNPAASLMAKRVGGIANTKFWIYKRQNKLPYAVYLALLAAFPAPRHQRVGFSLNRQPYRLPPHLAKYIDGDPAVEAPTPTPPPAAAPPTPATAAMSTSLGILTLRIEVVAPTPPPSPPAHDAEQEQRYLLRIQTLQQEVAALKDQLHAQERQPPDVRHEPPPAGRGDFSRTSRHIIRSVAKANPSLARGVADALKS